MTRIWEVVKIALGCADLRPSCAKLRPKLRRIALETRCAFRAKPSLKLFVSNRAERSVRTPNMQLSTFFYQLGLQEWNIHSLTGPKSNHRIANDILLPMQSRSFHSLPMIAQQHSLAFAKWCFPFQCARAWPSCFGRRTLCIVTFSSHVRFTKSRSFAK